MTTLRARIVFPVSGPAIEDGMVVIAHGKISAFDKWDGREATDLGEVILMPGLINAHCHLDYSVMRGAILSNRSFSQWVRRINELKRTLTDADYLESIRTGFEELLRHGTTSVFNIESFPELMVHMPPPPIRTWPWAVLSITPKSPAISVATAGARAICFRPAEGACV